MDDSRQIEEEAENDVNSHVNVAIRSVDEDSQRLKIPPILMG